MQIPKLISSLGLLGLLLLSTGILAAEREPAPQGPILSIPKIKTAPTIDGVIHEDEWAAATQISGFIHATGPRGGRIAEQESRIYLAHDGQRLYMAVFCELPAGKKPSMEFRRRDDPVYLDNYQLELWITPPVRDRTITHQMIGNAYGAIFDNRQIPDLGVTEIGWNGNWEFKNSYETGEHWMAELAIDFAELSDQPVTPDQLWRGLVAVAWPQRSWPYTTGFYKNIDSHAWFRFSDDADAVRITSLDSLFESRLAPVVEVHRGGPTPAEFTAEFSAQGVTVRDSIEVAPGQVRAFGFATTELPPIDQGRSSETLRGRVTGPGGSVLLEGDWLYAPLERAERERQPAAPEPWALSSRMQFAPLALGVRAWADVLDYPRRDALAAVRFSVLPENGSGGEITSASITDFAYDAAEAYLWLPESLPFGKYTLSVQFLADDGTVLESASHEINHENLRERFIWLGNDLGKEIEVRPPFEPVRVNGETIRVWGREIDLATSGGLPVQISSLAADLLASPIAIVAEIDGHPVLADVITPVRITEQSDTAALFEGAYRVAGLLFDLRGRIEFDGLIHFDFTTTAESPVAIDRLYISLPVKRQHAQYYFSTGGGWNAAYGIIDPTAEGLIWDSASLGDFVPYVGLADDDRAIQWYADSDHGWIQGDLPLARIVATTDAVEVQINLVRSPGVPAPIKGAFGFIASPVKPLPSHWRHTVLDNAPLADSKINFFYGPGHGDTPIDLHDSKRLALLHGLDIEGKNPDQVLADLPASATNLADISKENLEAQIKGDKLAAARNLLKFAAGEDPHRTIPCYFYNAKMYFEGNRSEAFRTFFPGEWTLNPPSWFHLTPVESYSDFFAFHLDNWFKHWVVPGLYFDEVYLGPDRNVFNGNGRLQEDGSVRPSYALMAQRNYLNRMRQLFFDHERTPFIWVHTSNYMAPHAISSADIAMFGEDRTPTPDRDIIDTIPAALMRSIGRSQKFGFIPVWMTMAGRGGPAWHLAGRQTMGWCWMHDTVPEVHTTRRGRHLVALRAKWGIDEEDVSFIPYWNPAGALASSDEKFIVSAWTRPNGTALLAVMNLHHDPGAPETATITISPEALGLDGVSAIYDLESGPVGEAYLAVTDEIDAMQRRDYRDPAAPALGREWDDAATRILADWRNWKPLANSPSFEARVPARNFKLYLVEDASGKERP